MKSESVEKLLYKAKILAGESKGGRRRYPSELKKIVRTLILKYKQPVHRVSSSVPVSSTSIRKWSKKQVPIKNTIDFKKISIKEDHPNTLEANLRKITVAPLFGDSLSSSVFNLPELVTKNVHYKMITL